MLSQILAHTQKLQNTLMSLIESALFTVLLLRKHVFKVDTVLIACMPKSGSTFLSGKLAALKGWERAHFVPDYGHREQELCLYQILFHCLRHVDKNLVAQHHVRLSSATAKQLAQYGIKVIVLTRDIADCMASLTDHHHRESVVHPTSFWTPNLWKKVQQAAPFSEFEVICRTNLAWYVNFYASWFSWRDFNLNAQTVGMRYEDLMSDQEAQIAGALRALDIPFNESELQAAIHKETFARQNVGIAGRGASQLQENKALAEFFESTFRCYPGIDFSKPIQFSMA